MTLNNSYVSTEHSALRDDLSSPTLGTEITNWGFILALQGQIMDNTQNFTMAVCCQNLTSLPLRMSRLCRQMTNDWKPRNSRRLETDFHAVPL